MSATGIGQGDCTYLGIKIQGSAETMVATQKGFFRSFDGTSIYYEVHGEGRPLIFCYGLVCRKEHWRHQVAHFRKKYRVILFDYRGHHRSSMPPNDRNFTLRSCAHDVQALIRHLYLKEAVCFGHSMGVPVVTHLSQLEAATLKALVFVCGSVSNPFEQMFFTHRMDPVYKLSARLYEIAPHTMGKLWRKFTEHNRLNYFLTSHLGFNARLAEREDVLMYLNSVNETPLSTFHSLLNDYTRFDGRALLPRITCPTLIIAGEEDCITPIEIHEEMAQLIPNAELQKISEGSHNAHMDRPREVNEKIENFLERTAYR